MKALRKIFKGKKKDSDSGSSAAISNAASDDADSAATAPAATTPATTTLTATPANADLAPATVSPAPATNIKKPEPVPEPEIKPQTAPAPVPVPTPTPTPAPAPAPAPATNTKEPQPLPEPEIKPQTAPAPAPVAVSEPEPTPTPTPATNSEEPEPVPQPEIKPQTAPASAPAPAPPTLATPEPKPTPTPPAPATTAQTKVNAVKSAQLWCQRGSGQANFIGKGPWLRVWASVFDNGSLRMSSDEQGSQVLHNIKLAGIQGLLLDQVHSGKHLIWLCKAVEDTSASEILFGLDTLAEQRDLARSFTSYGAIIPVAIDDLAHDKAIAEAEAGALAAEGSDPKTALIAEKNDVRIEPPFCLQGDAPYLTVRRLESILPKDVCLKSANDAGIHLRFSHLSITHTVQATTWLVIPTESTGSDKSDLYDQSIKPEDIVFEMTASASLPALVAGTWSVTISTNGGTSFQYFGLRFMVLRTDVVYAINLGGPEYVSTDGIRYAQGNSKDQYDRSDIGVIRTAKVPHQAILSTDDGFLYSSCLHTTTAGVKGTVFTGTAPSGDYVCTLKFAQIMEPVVGGYYMQVTVQDQVVVDRLDVMEKVGYQRAYDVEVPIKIGEDGAWKIWMLGQGGKCQPAPDSEEAMCFMNAIVISKQGAMSRLSNYPPPSDDDLKFSIPVVRTLLLDKTVKTESALTQNLLVNPCGEKDLEGWKEEETGGDGWMKNTGGKDSTFRLTSSFEYDIRSQEIDLVAAGFDEAYLDTSPDIHVADYYLGDNGEVKFRVELRDRDHNSITAFEPSEPITDINTNKQWVEISNVFSKYPSGVRYVYFLDGAKDGRFWKGHYGPSLSGSTVRVARPKQKADASTFKATDLDGIVVELINSKVDEDTNDGAPVAASTAAAETTTAVTTTKPTQQQQQELVTECRVFLSSTFRDFFAERELALKKVYPQLFALCSSRGVNLTFVDLRTGVTSEQSNNGRVLDICLTEIERCRPFFVSLVGERFGWHQPDDGPPDELLTKTFDYAIQRNPRSEWINKYRDQSATVLEAKSGILNDPELNKRSHNLCYMRDPAYIDTIEPAQQDVYRAESAKAAAKQQAFKKELLQSGVPIKNYTKPEQMAQLLLEDLTKAIQIKFPPLTATSQWQRQRQAHDAFAKSRALVYIGGEKYLQVLNDHLDAKDNIPLVIRGLSGGGKSALLANWTRQIKTKPEYALVFTHFIGATSESADHISLARRLMTEIQQTFQISQEIPLDDDKCLAELSAWIRAASSRGKIVIVLDALNQLVPYKAALALGWLPSVFPPEVRVVLSTLDDSPTWTALSNRQVKQLVVNPLTRDDKSTLIDEFMSHYSKTLGQNEKTLVLDAPQTDNPLYLVTLLKEIDLYGNFEQLNQYVVGLLNAKTIPQLFDLVLLRLENDYGRDSVMKLMTSMWGSRGGLTEAELQGVTGLVVRYDFSPLFLAINDHLVCRSGLYTFFHDYLRQAVVNRYLGGGSAIDPLVIAVRQTIVKYFQDMYSSVNQTPSAAATPAPARFAEELPFQLYSLGEKDLLRTTLLNLPIFSTLYDNSVGRFDLLRFWKLVGDSQPIGDGYKTALQKLKDLKVPQALFTPLIQKVSGFLQELGFYAAAQNICLSFPVVNSGTDSNGSNYGFEMSDLGKSNGNTVVEALSGPDRLAILRLLLDLGSSSKEENQIDEAVGYYTQALAVQPFTLCPEDKQAAAASLVGLGTVFDMKRENAPARYMFQAALAILKEMLGEDHLLVEACLCNLGALYNEEGLFDMAFKCYTRQLKILKTQVGVNHPLTAICLNNLAILLKNQGKLQMSLDLLVRSAAIFVDVYGDKHPYVATVSKNQANVLIAQGVPDQALERVKTALDIFKASVGDSHPDTKLCEEMIADLQKS